MSGIKMQLTTVGALGLCQAIASAARANDPGLVPDPSARLGDPVERGELRADSDCGDVNQHGPMDLAVTLSEGLLILMSAPPDRRQQRLMGGGSSNDGSCELAVRLEVGGPIVNTSSGPVRRRATKPRRSSLAPVRRRRAGVESKSARRVRCSTAFASSIHFFAFRSCTNQ